VVCAISVPLLLQVCLLFAIVIVALEKSDHYVEAAAVALVFALVQQYVIILPGLGRIRLVERWAARSIEGAHWTRPTAGLEGRSFAQWGQALWGSGC
jgi:hypothetical protein